MSASAGKEGGVGRDDGGRCVELEPSLVSCVFAVGEDERRALGIRSCNLGEPRRIDEERERYAGPETLDRFGQEGIARECSTSVGFLERGVRPLRVGARG